MALPDFTQAGRLAVRARRLAEGTIALCDALGVGARPKRRRRRSPPDAPPPTPKRPRTPRTKRSARSKKTAAAE